MSGQTAHRLRGHRDRRRLLAYVVALALTALACTAASAQSSGGAIGGGDWGGGGAPSHSSDDYSSSSRSTGGGNDYDYGGSSGSSSTYSGGGCEDSTSLWVCLGLVGLIYFLLAGTSHVFGERGGSTRGAYSPYEPRDDVAPPPARVDVTMLRIVLDARARGAVQAALGRLGTTAATGSAEGRVRMLNEVAILLRRNRAAWVYGAVSNHPMTTQDSARATFQAHVAAARSTYRDETIRNFDGEVSRAESSAVPASAEGPGLVMVSVMVAARRELVTVDRIGNGESLRRALEALSNLTPASLIAVEVVWTPSDPDDRMTSAEVERLLAGSTYAKIDGALVGVAVCDFCQGLYPAEAFACVHCGAAPRAKTGEDGSVPS